MVPPPSLLFPAPRYNSFQPVTFQLIALKISLYLSLMIVSFYLEINGGCPRYRTRINSTPRHPLFSASLC
jgi:uncharacterized membrane protein